MKDFYIVRSLCRDPSYNLAFEEYLTEKKDPVIYLWQNEPTVVIGRNQNPYKECNISAIRKDGVHLIRRRSGGGAVYHDLGNMNFTIISEKYPAVIEKNFALVGKVLSYCGINAQVSGRNDIEVMGKKVSGSAFYEDEDIFCHHGTLLVDVNLQRLSGYLHASGLKLKAKGINSVRSRVQNLSDIKKDITADRIAEAFSAVCGKSIKNINENELKNIKEVSEKAGRYISWEWTFGESMDYNVHFEKRFSWGTADAEFLVESGIITDCRIYTDSIINDNFEALSAALKDIKFRHEEISGIVEKTIDNPVIRKDLCSLFYS